MLVDLLELASNNALQHDEASRQRLTKLQGKTMMLEIRPIGQFGVQKITISPQPHGLEFSGSPDADPDVTLSATIGALIKIGRDGMDNAELEPGELQITGDPIIGQRFARILAELDIDWEGLMAEHIGETPAVLVATGFNKAKQIAQGTQSLVKQGVQKILKDDLGVLVDKQDLEIYLDDVDNLRADTERLQARIKRLQAKAG